MCMRAVKNSTFSTILKEKKDPDWKRRDKWEQYGQQGNKSDPVTL